MITMRYLFLSLYMICSLAVTGQDSLLSGLRQERPRLIATAEDFRRIAAAKETDTYLKTAYAKLYEEGEALLNAAPSVYVIPDGKRLLATSRRVVNRVSVLGLLYNVSGEERFAERAWKELLAASQFPDWNPTHFLDVGEMTYAFAIGYDWFYRYWNKDQRKIIKSAIMEKGLSHALLAYQGLATRATGWWPKVPHNWNQVCNGGIGVGALAIAEEEPQLTNEILKYVLEYLPLAMHHFAPDGAWNEGPGYWNYATRYNVAIIAAMETALGRDFGLSDIAGFAKTGLFPLYLNSPINRSFNYADGGDGAIRGAQLYWFAKRFNQPEVAQYLHRFSPADPYALIWYDPALLRSAPQLSTDGYFRVAEVASMRSRWNDPDATFVSFKAGDNKANHSHLDLGSFILDAAGERWIVDLGADNYNMPGYFNTAVGGKRWEYYRNRAEAHNTLVINPDNKEDQDPKAAAKIATFNTADHAAYALMDLTPAYARQARSVKRGIALIKKSGAVIVRDEISTASPSEVYWFAHTKADLSLSRNKRTATFSQNGKKYTATLLAPANAVFTIMPAAPLPTSPDPEEDNPNKGISKLAIHLSATAQTGITVMFHAGGSAKGGVFTQPLEKWEK